VEDDDRESVESRLPAALGPLVRRGPRTRLGLEPALDKPDAPVVVGEPLRDMVVDFGEVC
jgi:hypothetical protein